MQGQVCRGLSGFAAARNLAQPNRATESGAQSGRANELFTSDWVTNA